jgi:putative phosphoribosyl transferase
VSPDLPSNRLPAAHRFGDRRAGGQELAILLEPFRDEQPVVLALPRGGVPVAFAAADALDAPLDVVVVRKLGVPRQPELAMGAIGEAGVRVVNHEVVDALAITAAELDAVEQRERRELERRAGRYRGTAPAVALSGRTVILVDDGIATGSTMRAAIAITREQGARRVVVAVPVAPADSVIRLRHVADAVVCVAMPTPFAAIGQWYENFDQTSDAEVVELLTRARQAPG